MPDLSSVIEDAASAPKETSVDGTTVKEHDLQALIEADKYFAQKAAASNPRGGIRMAKIVAPGAS